MDEPLQEMRFTWMETVRNSKPSNEADAVPARR
jgi:hypothetical protein